MFNFLKTILFSGLAVLIPLILLFLALKEMASLMIVVATPLVDLFPVDTFDTEHEPELLAAILIVCAAMIIGMLTRVPATRVMWRRISDKTVGKLPLYRMLRTLSSAFLDMEDNSSFKPALIKSDSGNMQPAYIIEDHGGPLIVVLLPWSPTAFAGSIRLIQREQVRELQLSLEKFSLSLSNYGLGLSDQLPKHLENSKAF